MSHVRQFLPALMLVLASVIPAAADFAADYASPASIVIGVIPEINLVRQMERYTPLADYLEKRTGIKIEVKPCSNYGQLYEEMRDGNIDAGFFGSLVYGITRARIGIVPLARPVNLNGKSTYTGLLFARKDLRIRRPEDMKGMTIALVDPATSAGYLAQREYFAENGIIMENDLKIYWAGSHEAAIRAVLSSQAAVGGAKDTVVARFRRENRTFDTVIDILDENPKRGLPENTFAVRNGLNQQTKGRLKKALLGMAYDAEGRRVLAKFGAIRFIPTSDADFKPLYDWIRYLKIDLTTYPYSKH